MANTDTTKDTSVPIIRRIQSDPENIPVFKKYFSSFSPLAPAMTGIARKKENSALAVVDSPATQPPMMVEALRLMPGMMDRHWNRPMVRACLVET